MPCAVPSRSLSAFKGGHYRFGDQPSGHGALPYGLVLGSLPLGGVQHHAAGARLVPVAERQAQPGAIRLLNHLVLLPPSPRSISA